MLIFDNQGLNDVQNSRDYLAHVGGWGDTTNLPTDEGTWGAQEPDETTWGETPADRDRRLLTEAEQRVADMEVLDSGRLVGIEPTPAASDQESGELVLSLGEYCDRADGLSLFDLTSGTSAAPPATADSTVRSQWATRDAAARLAVLARYSSPATAALSHLMLPYLFPDLAVFPTVADLITHLRTSDTRYGAALPADFCAKNPPPPFCPTTLTVDLLEERLLAAETSIVAVGASRGDPRTPVFEGCSPSPLLPSVASAAAADLGGFESVGAASTPSGRRRTGKGKGGQGAGGAGGGGGGGGGGSGGGGGGGGSGGGGGGVGGSSGGGGGGGGGGGSGGGGGGRGGGGGGGGGGSGGASRGSAQRSGSGGGPRQQQQRSRATLSPQQLREWYAARQRGGGTGPCTYVLRTGDRFPDATEIPRWGELSRAGVAIFDLGYDAILATMYAVCDSVEGDCYLCVPPDQGIEAATLGTGEAAALGASASAAPGAGESALSGTTSAQAFHTFTLDSGASRSFFRDRTTLTPLSRPVAVSLADPSGGPVLASFSTVLPCPAAPSGTLSGLYLPSFSTNLTLLWHHRLGHPSLPRLRGMASHVLVSGLPRSLPPLPPGPTPACVPCVEGQQRAAPHSSEFPPTEAPLQTLHMDVKGDIIEVLIDWIRAARLRLKESFGSDFPLLRLHSDRGVEFSSARLGAFCRAQGIRQTFTLPASPQQNGIAERRIGMVMDVARTSMIHAAASHFLWPFAVQYAAHQLNLQPRVSLPETSPTLRWTGRLAMRLRFGSGDLGRLSATCLRTSCPPVLFPASSLASPLTRLVGSFTTPPRTVFCPPRTSPLTSRCLTTVSSPTALCLSPLPPLFLAPGPPPVDPLPPQGPAPSDVSQVDAVEPVEVAVDSGAARGAEPAGAGSGGAEPEGAEHGGAESRGAEIGGAEPGGAESGGA
ncbi:unnamed protein product [Closterium sp. NIES-53]